MHDIETLRFTFQGGTPRPSFDPILVGVVGSGNLEVLMEAAAEQGLDVTIETSARGFGTIWEAVLADFQERHRLAGARIAIHDMGATPAVVSLRLDQAAQSLEDARTRGRA